MTHDKRMRLTFCSSDIFKWSNSEKKKILSESAFQHETDMEIWQQTSSVTKGVSVSLNG